MPSQNMAPTLEPIDMGAHRVIDSRSTSAAHVGGWPGLLATVGRAVKIAGGAESWAASIGKASSKVYEALGDAPGRGLHLRWLLPLLREPRAAYELLAWLCEEAGYAAPVRKRDVTKEQLAAAVLAELDQAEGLVRDGLRERAAKRLGVRVEDLP